MTLGASRMLVRASTGRKNPQKLCLKALKTAPKVAIVKTVSTFTATLAVTPLGALPTTQWKLPSNLPAVPMHVLRVPVPATVSSSVMPKFSPGLLMAAQLWQTKVTTDSIPRPLVLKTSVSLPGMLPPNGPFGLLTRTLLRTNLRSSSRRLQVPSSISLRTILVISPVSTLRKLLQLGTNFTPEHRTLLFRT